MIRFLAGLALALAATVCIAAPQYPDRPISVLVGNGPGSGLDQMARMIANSLSEHYKQNVLVVNKPGAGGIIALRAAASAAPDGYTLAIGSTTSIALDPLIHKDSDFDAMKHFTPVASLGYYRLTLTTRPEGPKSYYELVQAARENPKSVTFGTGLPRSTQHVFATYLQKLGRIDVPIASYKGSASAFPDLSAGRITVMADAVNFSGPLHQQGKVRILAIDAEKRLASLPDVPTVGELYQGAIVTGGPWLVLLAPVGTPEPILQQLNRDVNAGLAKLQDRFDFLGITGQGGDLAAVRATMANQRPLWKRIVLEIGWKPE